MVNDTTERRVRLLRALGIILRIGGGVLLITAFLFALTVLFPSTVGSVQGGFVQWLRGIERGLAVWVRGYLPVHMAGLSHWIVIIALLVLGRALSYGSERCRDRIEFLRFSGDYERWKKEKHLTDDAQILSPVNHILEQLRSGKMKDREELLKVFAVTKKKLDEIGKNLAFLSVDVVDSTGMKVGEEKASVEHDFKEYKRFVEARLGAHNCIKASWTPDGTMGCFANVGDAVDAAKDLLSGLDGFNRQIKTMSRDFQVRCGINAGYVYFDPAIPLEEISDRVIDIAAHLQRSASPNGVCASKDALASLHGLDGFTPTGKVVLGYEVYEWKGPVDVGR